MRIGRTCLLLGVLITGGCSDLTAPSTLAGTWEQADTFPGSSLTFTLSADGAKLSGSGTWSGEACCDGTETIQGTESGGTVSLDFAFVTTGGAPIGPRTSHFTGTLTGRNSLVGKFDTTPSGSDVVFLRTN